MNYGNAGAKRKLVFESKHRERLQGPGEEGAILRTQSSAFWPENGPKPFTANSCAFLNTLTLET